MEFFDFIKDSVKEHEQTIVIIIMIILAVYLNNNYKNKFHKMFDEKESCRLRFEDSQKEFFEEWKNEYETETFKKISDERLLSHKEKLKEIQDDFNSSTLNDIGITLIFICLCVVISFVYYSPIFFSK